MNLNKAQVAIYIGLGIPITYLLFRHGRPGLIGWFYIHTFCILRIVGGALELRSTGKAGAVISSIGLSPLLIGTSGLLHEARYYRNPNLRRDREWPLIAAYHLVVLAGLGLVASASSAFQGTDVKSSTLTLLKVGMIILLVSWVILCAWSLLSLLPSQRTRDAPGYLGGTKLLYGILFSLPFIGIRMVYSVVSTLAPSKNLNPTNPAFGFRLALSFLPEVIAVLAFVFVGLATQTLRRDVKMSGGDQAPNAYRLGERNSNPKTSGGAAYNSDRV